MISLWRLLRWVMIAGVVLAPIAAGAGWWLASRSLPVMDGSRRLPGLDLRVEVIRDTHGIAHAFAAGEHDAYYTLGYLHATDRLWQMDLARRAAQGRLSEQFGEALVGTDKLMRALDLDGLAASSVESLPATARRVLTAYAAGVNARLAELTKPSMGAPEFLIFGDGIDRWGPADSIAVLKVMAFRLSQHSLASEIKRGRFRLSFDSQDVADLFPDYPGQGSMTLPPLPRAADTDLDAELPDDTTSTAGGGSNIWAVDGRHSASRAPLLANDPHLPLEAPSSWYPVHLSWPGHDLIGGSVPGIPAIVIGRNASIAWGLTAAQIDDADFFLEKLAEGSNSAVMRGVESEAMRLSDERIAVKGERDIEWQRRETDRGPVLPLESLGLSSVTPVGHVPVLSWTALEPADTSFAALHALNGSETVPEALSSVDGHIAPALNLLVADRQNIGMALVGRVPLRRFTSNLQGRVPSPGWTQSHDWVGFLPKNALPAVVNPPGGHIANANNRVGSDRFPRHLSYHWDAPYRFDRIGRLLRERRTHSLDGFRAMQSDTVSPMARALAPLMAGLLEGRDGLSPLAAEAYRLIIAWNGDMDARRPEPLIFSAWLDRVVRGLTEDELGGLAKSYRGPRPLFVERVLRDIEGGSRWCDDTRTEGEESCAQIVLTALNTAVEALAKPHGPVIERWRWGEAHKARHSHAALGDVGFRVLGTEIGLSGIVNISHQSGGGNFTLNRAASPYAGREPFADTHGAGMRVVYDLADLDRSQYIVSTGVSGHPLSPYYANLNPLWARGELVSMSVDRASALAGSRGRLILLPPE